jgi:hypothetical protein
MYLSSITPDQRHSVETMYQIENIG